MVSMVPDMLCWFLRVVRSMGGKYPSKGGVGGGGGWRWKSRFFGTQISLAYRLVQFHRGPQNSRFPAPNPPPHFLTSCTPICPHQKHYARGRRKHRCINSYLAPASRGNLILVPRLSAPGSRLRNNGGNVKL